MDWRLENVFTITAATLLVLGLFFMSHSWHSLWGLLLLLNLNFPKAN